MKPLRLVFVKIGICLSLYSVATIWHFGRRSYSLNSVNEPALYIDCAPAVGIESHELRQTAILLPPSSSKEQTPNEKPKGTAKDYRILFVKEDEKR